MLTDVASTTVIPLSSSNIRSPHIIARKPPPELPACMCRHVSHASSSLRHQPCHDILLSPDVCAPPLISLANRIHGLSEPLPPLHLRCDLGPSALVSSPSALSRLPVLVLLVSEGFRREPRTPSPFVGQSLSKRGKFRLPFFCYIVPNQTHGWQLKPLQRVNKQSPLSITV
jgi:hypothetical protein